MVRPWRWLHGSQSSMPSHSTSPTRNRLPSSSLRSIPRVATFRRDSAAVSSMPFSSASASSASVAISVSSRSRSGWVPGPSKKFRSPLSPRPGTARTRGTGFGSTSGSGEMLISTTCPARFASTAVRLPAAPTRKRSGVSGYAASPWRCSAVSSACRLGSPARGGPA